jgi:DNA anti-recombination protein RmuC
MVVPDFRVNGKVVEFALVLPDGSRLPLDSKWTAVRELEELEQAEDPDDRKSIGDEIEVQVAKRAREVACYIDPPHTTPFAVACVPDAAYQACKKAHGDAYQRGVVIVPYSSAVPTVLTLHLLATRFGGAGDTRAVLAEIATLISDMGNTLENKVVKATTMLSNGADELRTSLGRARGAVARGSVQASEGLGEEEAETPALQLVD